MTGKRVLLLIGIQNANTVKAFIQYVLLQGKLNHVGWKTKHRPRHVD